MLVAFIALWWFFSIGFFNVVLRPRRFSYGGTPRKTGLFYLTITALTLALFAPMSFAWPLLQPQTLFILGGIMWIVAIIDSELCETFPPADRKKLWYGTLVKYTDIFYQQFLIFLLFVSIIGTAYEPEVVVTLFAALFVALHLPAWFVMPRSIAWTFIGASIVGGILFPYLYLSAPPTIAALSAYTIHALFYTVLRAFEHHSDLWVHFLEQD